MRLTIEVARFLDGLAILEGGISNALGFAVRDGILAAEASGKATSLFNDRTGVTRNSIHGVYDGLGRGSVFFGGASRVLNSGTRPHVIQGRPLLRFVVNGKTIFARSVNHPGTAERPFVDEARQRAEQVVDYAAAYYVSEAIRRV